MQNNVLETEFYGSVYFYLLFQLRFIKHTLFSTYPFVSSYLISPDCHNMEATEATRTT